MKLAIRVDTGTHIGSGHLMRCITFAEICRQAGADVAFVSREHAGHLTNLIPDYFRVISLPQLPLSSVASGPLPHSHWLGCSEMEDAQLTITALQEADFIPDACLVDHYSLSGQWESELHARLACKLIVIDGLQDRPHSCQVLVNPTLKQYVSLKGVDTLLEGPSFLPLRDEFKEISTIRTRQELNNFLVCFGGVDQENWTLRTYKALRDHLSSRSDVSINVVVGSGYLHLDVLKDECELDCNTTLHVQTSNIARLMVDADIMIGAGGTIAWERCALGLPAICWTIAENQRSQNESLAREGAIVYLGGCQESAAELLVDTLRGLEKEKLGQLSAGAKKLMINWQENSRWLEEILNFQTKPNQTKPN